MTDQPDPRITPDTDRALDDRARQAGARLRGQAAPADAGALVHRAKRRQTMRYSMATGAAAVIAVGAFVVVNTSGDGVERQASTNPTVVGQSSAPPIEIVTTAPTPAPVTTVSPVSAAPPTTAATNTSIPAVTASPAFSSEQEQLRWALEYTGGTEMVATGEPFRVGVAHFEGYSELGWEQAQSAEPMRRAADYINAKLGGVRGRPIEIVECDAFPDGAELPAAAACAQSFLDADVQASLAPGEFLIVDPQPFAEIANWAFGGTNGVNVNGSMAQWIANLLLAARDQVPADRTAKVAVLIPQLLPEGMISADFEARHNLEVVMVQQGQDVTSIVAEIRRTGTEDVDAAAIFATGCDEVAEAYRSLDREPLIVMSACAMRDGWYGVDRRIMPDNPAIETGAATLAAINPEDFNDGALGGAYWTADLFALVRIVNGMPPGTDPTTAEIRQAVETYVGPWPLKRADVDCTMTGLDVMVPSFAGDCSTVFDVFHLANGKWEELDPVDVES